MENNIQKEDLRAFIQSKIYVIRGQRVMLDRDLATIYGVETKVLNQSVKRNNNRFEGDDFMFRLTKEEATYEFSRSQNVTMNKGRGYNMKYPPYAFTELGVAMLSSVLKSETAIYVNREIMRAFVEFRHLTASLTFPNTAADVVQLRKDFEELKLDIEDILHDQNDINESTRLQLEASDAAILELQAEHRQQPKRKPIGFVQPKEDEEEKK